MFIDPFRFCRTSEQLERELSLLPEGRLQGIIAGKSDIILQLNGSKEANRSMLEGHIGGAATVQCQVCLEEIQIPLDVHFRLFPVSSEQKAERLDQKLEPIVIEDNSLALEELVINELILSMSVTYSHIEIDGRDCAEKDNISTSNIQDFSQEEKNLSPFAILQSMKQKDS